MAFQSNVIVDILQTMRFRGSVFFHSQLAAPWGMSLSPTKTPRFHIATRGKCFVGTGDASEVVNVHEMEVALLANGDEHWIADAVGRDLVPSDNAAKACELLQPLFQDGTITNELICGVVRFDEELIHPILHGLPEILHFTGIEHDAAIWTTAMTIDTHLRSGGSLLEPIVDRLAEALFLQLLERHVETQETTGFLSSLNDRRMNLAITLLHQQLEFNWSLASLGEKTGMSRATLIRRFQEAVGMSPMAYLTQWRLMKAHSLVKYSPKTMEQISQSIGFSSSRSFSKAFVRAYGYSPSELRRRASKQ